MSGKVMYISSDIIDIKFPKSSVPKMGTILHTTSGNVLSIELISGEQTVRAVILKQNSEIKIGDKVTSTKKPLQVVVGKQAMGRIFNVLGETTDNLAKIAKPLKKSVKVFNPIKKVFREETVILETGIKAIDFFVPILKGNKIGLFGGAGLGKTLIIKELINNISKSKEIKNPTSIMVGIGERSREGHELYNEMKEAKLLSKMQMFFAQMNEMPGARMKIIYPAITSAEYFRDEMKKDVLMFIDNIFRFSQAGSELSSSLGKIPSQSGYQPTLVSEISNVEERLSNSKNGTITTFQTVFVPADDITDPAAVAVFSHLDASLVLDRKISSAGRYPAIDPLNSNSANINENIIGWEHMSLLSETKRYLQRYDELEDLLAILGAEGISSEDLLIVNRTRKIQNYFTQNFFTAEDFLAKKGQSIPLKDTLDSVKRILDGEFDDHDPEEFLYIGTVDEIEKPEPEKKEKKLSKKEQKILDRKNKRKNKEESEENEEKTKEESDEKAKDNDEQSEEVKSERSEELSDELKKM